MNDDDNDDNDDVIVCCALYAYGECNPSTEISMYLILCATIIIILQYSREVFLALLLVAMSRFRNIVREDKIFAFSYLRRLTSYFLSSWVLHNPNFFAASVETTTCSRGESP
jgi:hypothetical protein